MSRLSTDTHTHGNVKIELESVGFAINTVIKCDNPSASQMLSWRKEEFPLETPQFFMKYSTKSTDDQKS